MRRGRGRRRHSRRDQSAAGERIDLGGGGGGVRVTVPDGDGLTLVSAPGAGGGRRWERLRLWGIDAPEFPDQPFGHEARERLIALVAAAGEVRRTGRRVELRVRPGITARIHRGLVGGLSNDRDKYGRAVVTLHDAAGLCINEALVEAGLAWRYFDDGAYERAQSAAQAAGVGVHTPGMDPVKPWDWRKRLAKERAKSDADREGRWWPWAVLAVVVLLLYAVVAGASAPTGEDAAVRSWAACDARAASLSRATRTRSGCTPGRWSGSSSRGCRARTCPSWRPRRCSRKASPKGCVCSLPGASCRTTTRRTRTTWRRARGRGPGGVAACGPCSERQIRFRRRPRDFRPPPHGGRLLCPR